MLTNKWKGSFGLPLVAVAALTLAACNDTSNQPGNTLVTVPRRATAGTVHAQTRTALTQRLRDCRRQPIEAGGSRQPTQRHRHRPMAGQPGTRHPRTTGGGDRRRRTMARRHPAPRPGRPTRRRRDHHRPAPPHPNAFRACFQTTPDLAAAVTNSASGAELAAAGFTDDVAIASELDTCATVPVLTDGAFSATG